MNAERIKALADAYAHTFLNPGDFHQPEKDNLYAAIEEMQRELNEARAALNDRIENVARLNSELDAVRAELDHIKAEHNSLLFSVSRKFGGESRYQTALRYIIEMERMASGNAVQVELNKIEDKAAENSGQDYLVGE